MNFLAAAKLTTVVVTPVAASKTSLVTSLAMICPFGAPEKQALLEAMSLPERARTMTAIMEMAVHEPGGATH